MSSADRSADDATFPRELLAAPPRSIVKGWSARLATWMFAGLTLIVPAVLGVVGYRSQVTYQKILEHGVESPAQVVEKRPPHKDSSPQLVFEYRVDGTAHRIAEARTREVWAVTPLGTEATIVYLPEDPASAYSEHKIATEGSSSTTATALWIISGVVALIMTPIWFYIERKYSKLRRLARSGRPTIGTVTSVDRFGGSRYDHWTVKYEFSTPTKGARDGKSYVTGTEVGEIGGAGSKAIVMFDPDDERNYELYAAVTKQYRIVIDEFSAPNMNFTGGKVAT
jgi:hypothetical protein